MKRWLALLLLFASCGGCTSFDESSPMSSTTTAPPSWLTRSSSGPSETFFKRPFE